MTSAKSKPAVIVVPPAKAKTPATVAAPLPTPTGPMTGPMTVSQLARELGVAPLTIRLRARRMKAKVVGRAYFLSAAQANVIRADPPKARVRVKGAA